MQQAMVKEGRTGYQMVYSQRDLEWMLKNGWKKAPETDNKETKPETKPREKLTLPNKGK